MPIDDADLAEALDHLAITRLQAAYGDAVTRRAWDELEAMFLPDCRVRLDLRGGSVLEKVGGAEVAAFIAASVERFEFFAFTLQNTVVEVAPGGVEARSRLYIRELRQERATHRWTTAFGLYRDTCRKVDGRWRFASRDYASLARGPVEGGSMDVFPVPSD
ncbi:MAG: nuclear transport factor 2 family protein [Acidimicrobiales bacterium]|jgi:hypothetical protein|nr:nuclear transport factor 2 family protein [Acidimicrobiales bacterium]